MLRTGRVSIGLLGWIVLSVSFATPQPSSAGVLTPSGPCVQWDMSGEWTFVQSNNTSPVFKLMQTRSGLQGSASYGVGPFAVSGSVDGTIKGNSFEVTAYWNNGTTGLYKGKVGPRGRIEGDTYDKQHPNVMARWYSDRTAKCLPSPSPSGTSAGGATPPAQDEGAIKPQGRVKTGTSFPKLSICEAAEKARARNSPAAPGLEAKCAAARNAASDTAVEEQVDTAGKGKALPPKDEACDWRGESPFCNGRCAPGEIKMAAENDSEAPFPRAHPDFGTSCATGFKFYCCRQ